MFDLDKKTINKIVVAVVGLIVLYICLNYWSGITGILTYMYNLVFPFILGGCIAFILNIPVSFFKRSLSKVKGNKASAIIKKIETPISLLLACFIVIGILVLISYIVIPSIFNTIKVLPETFQSSTVALNKWISTRNWNSGSIGNIVSSLQISYDGIVKNVTSYVKDYVVSGASSMVTGTIGVATSFASGIFDFIIGFVFAIYILVQKEKLKIQFKKVLYAFVKEDIANYILEVAELTRQTFSSFITGQCLESTILGVMFFISMSIFGFPYAVVGSVIIGCTSIVPVLGSVIGCVLVEFLIVMSSPTKGFLFLIVYIIIKQLEDNLIYPRIVGNSVGLPSIWVLMVITVSGKLMGITGMVVSIPLFSVAYVLFRKEVYKKLRNKGISVE